MPFCTKCGSKNDDGEKVCKLCGAKLRQVKTSAAYIKNDKKDESFQEVKYSQSQNSNDGKSFENQQYNLESSCENPKKKMNKGLFAFIVIVVIIGTLSISASIYDKQMKIASDKKEFSNNAVYYLSYVTEMTDSIEDIVNSTISTCKSNAALYDLDCEDYFSAMVHLDVYTSYQDTLLDCIDTAKWDLSRTEPYSKNMQAGFLALNDVQSAFSDLILFMSVTPSSFSSYKANSKIYIKTVRSKVNYARKFCY